MEKPFAGQMVRYLICDKCKNVHNIDIEFFFNNKTMKCHKCDTVLAIELDNLVEEV